MSETAKDLTRTETPPEDVVEPSFGFTEAAAEKIKTLETEDGSPAFGLRVGVRGGGCNGFSYFMEVAPEGSLREDKDRLFEAFGARVIVDKRSLKILHGTELRWETGLMGSRFEFRNPNVDQACGCGSSFSVNS